LLKQELEKYGALIQCVPRDTLSSLASQYKVLVPELYRLLEPRMLATVSSAIDNFFNEKIGVLCLSEVRDSILMWGHYTNDHHGFVVGFDSNHPFFSSRRTDQDEFGFLRQVVYSRRRPAVTLTDTSSPDWFQTKSEQWGYEKEWRIVRVLTEASCRLDSTPFPIYLFEFPPDAVQELIVGMRSTPSVIKEVRSFAAHFPKAVLLRADEHPSDYALVIEELRSG
jgi:hypothetical protein